MKEFSPLPNFSSSGSISLSGYQKWPSSSFNNGSSRNGSKPLPLKQRTSSIDTRKDFSIETWTSLLDLLNLSEYFITVNHFSLWRRHLCWGMPNGGDLRNYMTQRYASNMVFLSLLLGTELSVLFNSAAITTQIRHALQHHLQQTLAFWIGLIILLSIILTILSLITTFTAWGMVSAISDENAHCILRSSIGQYVGELPQRFIVTSIYSFLLWVILFVFELLPLGFWSIFLVTVILGLFFHVVSVFSAFGRIILHTGAMAPHRIFEERYEQSLLPQSLHGSLLKRAKAELASKTSITRQYRRMSEPLDRDLSEEDIGEHLRRTSMYNNNGTVAGTPTTSATMTPASIAVRKRTSSVATTGGSLGSDAMRKRADSSVRFADRLWTTIPGRQMDENDRMSEASREGSGTGSGTVTPINVSSANSSGSNSPPNFVTASVDSATTVAANTSGSRRTSPPPPPPPPPSVSREGSLLVPDGFSTRSIQSLEEWLAAGHTPESNRSKTMTPQPTQQGKEQQKSPQEVPIPSPRLPPPSDIRFTSSSSLTVSSTLTPPTARPLTDDEKFDRDYGDLFDPEVGDSNANFASSEQQGLLETAQLQEGYASVAR